MHLQPWSLFVFIPALFCAPAAAQSHTVVRTPAGTVLPAQPSAPQAAVGFCFGTTGCPCANDDTTSGFGCLNSSSGVFQHGGQLDATGTPKVSLDTLVLSASATSPEQLAIYFQGTQSLASHGVSFGDGVRCVSGAAIRLATKTSTHDGHSGYGGPLGDVPVSVRGHVPSAGGTFYYQVWYHDPHAVCAGSASNYTNALAIAWTP